MPTTRVVNDISEEDFENDPLNDTPRRPISVDPIAVSCWMQDNNQGHWDFYNDERIPTPTESQMHKAEKIRRYYSETLMMESMRGVELTKFRADLARFLIDSNPKPDGSSCYRHENLGMIVSLPKFYDEDMFLKDLAEKYPNKPFANSQHESGTFTLTHIHNYEKKTALHGRRQNAQLYWFGDEEDRLYSIPLAHNDPFKAMWLNAINKPITISAVMIKHRQTKIGLNYYMPSLWELALT